MGASTITATINYHDRREAERFGKAILDLADFSKTTFVTDPREVEVHDARQASEPPTLDANGFALFQRPTAVTDFYDPAQVADLYYPEVQALLRELLGAEEVFVFGEVLRSDDPERLGRGRPADAPRDPSRSGPAAGVHIDFNEEAVRNYVVDLAGADRAESLLKKRFINVNLWRPISPIERMPLGICDASSIDDDDLIAVETHNPVGASTAPKDGYNLAYGPGHRWSYFPAMEPDEVLVFKIFDSDSSVAHATPHAAFADPTSAPDAAARESFEIRTICILPQ